MKSTKFLIPLVCSLAFGLAACGSDPADDAAAAGGNNPFAPTGDPTGQQPVGLSSAVIVASSASATPVSGTVLPLASGANAAFSNGLYDSWKSAHVKSIDEESVYYASIASGYSYVFSAEYLPASRVLWSGQSTGYYADKCRVDDSTDPKMKFRGCTVSEGIGYGMLITAFQDNAADFNSLWNYSRGMRAYNGRDLTPWITYSFHYNEIDVSSATDADLDIATSLLIMYAKTAQPAYLTDALSVIAAIWDGEVNKNNYLLYSGYTSMWTKAGKEVYNLSYFSPVALRLFAMYDKSHDWNKVLDAMYAYMAKIQAAGTGVFPDWSDETTSVNPPNDAAGNEKTGFTYYTFNKESVRIPWRIAWDYYWFQDARAGAILKTLNDFIVGKSGGDPTSIALATNYSWNLALGPDISKNSSVPSQWLAGWCVTGIGTNTTWLDGCTNAVNKQLLTNNNSSYFSDILLVMYSQLLNGKYVKPATLGL